MTLQCLLDLAGHLTCIVYNKHWRSQDAECDKHPLQALDFMGRIAQETV